MPTTVLFVSFQAQGTLGRILQDGASKVRIHSDEIKIRARMRALDLYSGHADAPELKAWLSDCLPVRRGVFLVHGEDSPLKALQASLADLDRVPAAIIREIDGVYDLAGDRAVRIERYEERLPPASAGHRDWHNDYAELLNSPIPEARPFRTLHTRYPIEDLAEAFAEGITTGHPSMPQSQFDPAHIDDLLAYLNSIQG